MNKQVRIMTQSALLASVYVVLTHLQNLLLPGSASWAIQFRMAECMCVLAFFTPSAIWGLTVGCLLFNITSAGALPLDAIVGSLATFLATGGMYLTRNVKLLGYPLPGMVLPAVCNGLLVGWELSVYIGGAFWLNFLYVAVSQLAVLLILGTALYYIIRRRQLHRHII